MATIQELESFKLSDAVKFHKELNPKLWEDEKLDPEVRDQLLLIAEDFVEYLGLDNLKVEDVTISGSNAAYSYTPHSDLDLHILVDFNKLPNDPVYQELFTAKKTLYNDAHDITVHGVPVELYVQDINEPVQSLGQYSIVHDKWIRIPKKRRANFDEVATKAKYEKLGDLIELALKSRDPKKVKDTIALVKRYRKSGLDKHGEFGPENLAYKAVRKQGLVQALYDLKAELHGEKLSIEESTKFFPAVVTDITQSIPDVKEIWFHGSRATRTHRRNSDWDILVIVSPSVVGDAYIETVFALQKIAKKYKNFDIQPSHPDEHIAVIAREEGTQLYPAVLDENKLLDKPTLSVSELAEKHGVSRMDIATQLDKGIKVELEHTNDKKVAREIALDHLAEDPKYYDKLTKLELEEEIIDLRVYRNPSPKQLFRLTQRSAHKHMRGMYHGGDTYWWDGNDAIHKQGSDYLGIPYDYQMRMEAAIDSVSDNYRVGGDDGVPQDIIQKYDIENELVYETKLEETAEENQIVNVVSNIAAAQIAKVMKAKESKLLRILSSDMYSPKDRLELFGVKVKDLNVPNVNNPLLKKLFSILYIKVKSRVYFLDDPSAPRTLGGYYDGDYTIELFFPALEYVAGKRETQLKSEIASTLAHEIQHAIDDYKSDNAVYGSSKISPDKDMQGYLKLPYEVNARFQEATMDIAKYIVMPKNDGSKTTQADLLELIRYAFHKNSLDKIYEKNQKEYKRLLTRAYKFFQAELNSPKKATPIPQNIAKRALNWILGKQTKEINEASGYIPSEKEKNDPRFKTALTVDVKPDSIKKNAKAFSWKTSRAGIPPQARADGKITEALISYTPDKKFVNEKEEVQYVATTVKDWRVRARIFETIASRNINESTNNYQTIRDRVMKSLVAFSTNKLKIGNSYIPIQINILRDSLLFYDVKGNSPAQEPAEFGTLVELSNDEAKIRINNKLYNYPIHIDSANLMMVTVFLDSAEKYDQLRMMVSLEFEQSLPPLKPTAGDTVTERLMNEWKSFLAEDEQQELFPGYDKKHRQERLNAWLGKSHAMAGKKPKVLYHATTKDFDQFRVQNQGWVSGSLIGNVQIDRTGIFLAENPKFAEEFIKNTGSGPEWKENAVIIPVYLSAQYPFSLLDNSLLPMLRDEALVEKFDEHGIDLKSIYHHYYEDKRWELFDGPEGQDFVQNLKTLGYDSAVMQEEAQSHGGSETVWIAFSPNQVKAITNRGSFSPDDPRMMREDQKNIVPLIGYHVTATKNLPIIKKNGIKADKRGNSYIWDSREMAEWFMDFQNDEGQDRTILKIDMSGLDAQPDPEAEDMSEWSSRFKPGTNGGAWIISGPIPPNKIIG